MSLSRQFTQEVTYAVRDGVTDSGDPQFGPQRTVRARHDRDSRRLIDPQGNERDVRHKVMSSVEIPMDSEVWLPGENTNEPSKHRPITTLTAVSFRGQDIFEMWL